MPVCVSAIHTVSGLAMAIFPIVFALDTLLNVEIQNSDVCHNAGALFDLTTLAHFKGEHAWAKRKPKDSAKYCRIQFHTETHGLRCCTAVGHSPGFATFSL